MGSARLIGQVEFKVRYIPTNDILETVIDFEDRGETIYYCWTIKDKIGGLIAGKCLSIRRRAIATDDFDFCINHARRAIDSYRIDRQKFFQIEEVKKR